MVRVVMPSFIPCDNISSGERVPFSKNASISASSLSAAASIIAFCGILQLYRPLMQEFQLSLDSTPPLGNLYIFMFQHIHNTVKSHSGIDGKLCRNYLITKLSFELAKTFIKVGFSCSSWFSTKTTGFSRREICRQEISVPTSTPF
jgi:hypothetical protein